MSRFNLIITILVMVTSFILNVSAADTDISSEGVDVTQKTTPLLLDTVSVSEVKSINLIFNQAIRVDSIRVRIIDQSTNESVKVESITGPSTGVSDSTAIIHTATSLTAGASYVLTITSALSMTEMTIKAGVDSIREFTVPANLAGSSLNAPPNPSAVIVSTGSDPKPIMTPNSVTTPVVVAPPTPQITEALPETGTSTWFLVILAAVSAFGLLLVRKKV